MPWSDAGSGSAEGRGFVDTAWARAYTRAYYTTVRRGPWRGRDFAFCTTEISGLGAADIDGKDGEKVLELVFRRLSANVTDQYSEQVRDKDLLARLAALTKLLDERDFFPETEMVDGVVHIKLLNCPFRAGTLKNDSVCTFDSHLMSAMFDMDVERRACIHDGDTGCVSSGGVGDRDAEMLVAAIER